MTPAGAEFSECRKYRYKLWRIWNKRLPKAMCIGLNPSNAKENKNDATINNLIAILTKLGYGGFYMMNCFPFVESQPKFLQHMPIANLRNDNAIDEVYKLCDDVIFCWGTFDVIKSLGRDKELMKKYPSAKCFGINKDGSPFHPRALTYIKGALKAPQLFTYNSHEL